MTTPPYDSRTDRIERVELERSPGGILYFASIGGREPGDVQFEWSAGPLTIDNVRDGTIKRMDQYAGERSVPVVMSFPHISRLFMFQAGDGKRETNYDEYLRWNTSTGQKIEFDNRPGRRLHGCLLELEINGIEGKNWGLSESVEHYLSIHRDQIYLPCVKPNKLRDHHS